MGWLRGEGRPATPEELGAVVCLVLTWTLIAGALYCLIAEKGGRSGPLVLCAAALVACILAAVFAHD